MLGQSLLFVLVVSCSSIVISHSALNFSFAFAFLLCSLNLFAVRLFHSHHVASGFRFPDCFSFLSSLLFRSEKKDVYKCRSDVDTLWIVLLLIAKVIGKSQL